MIHPPPGMVLIYRGLAMRVLRADLQRFALIVPADEAGERGLLRDMFDTHFNQPGPAAQAPPQQRQGRLL